MESSREEVEKTLATSGDSLLLCDAKGRIVDANEAVCSLTGYDRHDLLSKSIGDLAEAGAITLISSLREDATLDLEAGIRCKDGSTQPLKLRLRTLRIGNHPHSVVRVARHRRAADRLPEDPDFIRALLQSSGMIVLCVSEEGNVVFANAAFETLIGLSFREIRGRKAWELVSDPAKNVVLRELIESAGARRALDAPWPASDGDPRILSWTVTALTPKPEGPVQFLLVGRDVQPVAAPEPAATPRLPIRDDRRRHELEERISQLTRELDKVRREHEALTYTLAHDLRAPLRAMSGLSDALVEECAQPETDQGRVNYALRIAHSAQQMDALIENLLVYNRLNRMEVQIGSLSLDSVVAEVLQAHAREIHAREAGVTVDVPPLQVPADRSVLFLLVFHLLSNALKFVRPGTAPDLTIRGQRLGDGVRLSVRDNGIGIPAEYHGVIFGLCERLHPAETYPGSGMGLAIVGKAAERIGARIGLESEPGKGSCFWIDLPAAGPAA